MRQPMHIEMDDGRCYEIDADGRDIRGWEAEHESSFLKTPLSFIVLCQLAYLAGQRLGVFDIDAYPSYKDFDAHCVEATGRRPEIIGDPTQRGLTGDSSARSLSGSAPRHQRSKTKAL